MARLTGALDKDRDLEMDAQEVGGAGRKTTVKRRAAGDYINVVVNGSATAPDGDYRNIPRVAGGMGGGGGQSQIRERTRAGSRCIQRVDRAGSIPRATRQRFTCTTARGWSALFRGQGDHVMICRGQ
jgi:hypothetical protein